jgi:PAS domain S-box-containing protein
MDMRVAGDAEAAGDADLGVARRRTVPLLPEAVFTVAYVLAAGFAQWLAIIPHTGISIWPPSGVFIATLIHNRPATWPRWIVAAALGEAIANLLWFHNGLPVFLLIYLGNALEAVLAASLVLRVCRPPVRLESLKEVFVLVVLAAGVAPLVSATVGSATLLAFFDKPMSQSWLLWWIGDATGVMVLAPLTLVALQSWQDGLRPKASRIVEIALLGAVFIGVAVLALSDQLPYAYIIMPPLLWAAVRFEFKGAVVALALLAVIAAGFTASGLSQFAGDSDTQEEKHVMLQLFLAVSALSALVVASISRQRQQALLRLQATNRELEQRVAERAASLQESEARLRLALSAGRAGTWDHDMVTGRMTWSEAQFRLLGFEPRPDGVASVELWRDLIVEEDLPGVLRQWARALKTREPFVAEHRIRRADTGEIVYLHGTGHFAYNEAGRAVRFAGVVFDVTELKRHEQRQQMLINELSHRVKNTLATVQSIAMQSLRGRSEAQATEDFVGRLIALARGHDLLANESWEGAPLDEVVRRAIAPHAGRGGSRVVVAHGPQIWMPPRQALAITLALHELCTNAAKYGALCSDAGWVAIDWQLLEGGRYRLTWREHGGPPVTPPQRRGFGSRLLERGLKQDLDGEIQVSFPVEGVVCVIEAPVPQSEPAAGLDLQEGPSDG